MFDGGATVIVGDNVGSPLLSRKFSVEELLLVTVAVVVAILLYLADAFVISKS